jgi:hypothetical protein
MHLANQEAARKLEETARMPVQTTKGPDPGQRAIQRATEQMYLDFAEMDRKYAAEQAAIKAATAERIAAANPYNLALEKVRLEAQKPENKNDPEKMKKLEAAEQKLIAFSSGAFSSGSLRKTSEVRNNPELMKQIDANRLKLIASVTAGSLPSSQALANSAALLNSGTQNESNAIDVALLTTTAMGSILANTVNNANAATRTLEESRGKKPLAKPAPKRPTKPKPPPKPKGRK